MASMGPASENAGYRADSQAPSTGQGWLQWVQRPRTPVISHNDLARKMDAQLQWVQRPRTPVIRWFLFFAEHEFHASMGPASENAGYFSRQAVARSLGWLQ